MQAVRTKPRTPVCRTLLGGRRMGAHIKSVESGSNGTGELGLGFSVCFCHCVAVSPQAQQVDTVLLRYQEVAIAGFDRNHN